MAQKQDLLTRIGLERLNQGEDKDAAIAFRESVRRYRIAELKEILTAEVKRTKEMTRPRDTNELPTVHEAHMNLADELGGGSLTLTCRGNFGIAPIFLQIGGVPVTGIATVYQNGDVVEKWVHNSLEDADSWFKRQGASQDERQTLLADLGERMIGVISDGELAKEFLR